MPLQLTDHPTQANEFFSIYSRAIYDVLRSYRGAVWRPHHALKLQRLGIERALQEIGYFRATGDSTWLFRQSGYSGSIPDSWLKLPVEVFAEKIANLGIDMLNERCRQGDVQVERI